MVIFLYNLGIFVLIQHGYLDNTVFTLDISNRLIKRLCVQSRQNHPVRVLQSLMICTSLLKLSRAGQLITRLGRPFHILMVSGMKDLW